MTYDPRRLSTSSSNHQAELTPYLEPELIRQDAQEDGLTQDQPLMLLRAVKLTFWCGLLAFNFYALMLMLWAWVALLVHLASGLPLMVPWSQFALWLAPLLGLSAGLKVISGYVLDLLGRAHAPQVRGQLAP